MRSMGRTVPTWRRRVEMELEGLEAYRKRTEGSRAEKALDDGRRGARSSSLQEDVAC